MLRKQLYIFSGYLVFFFPNILTRLFVAIKDSGRTYTLDIIASFVDKGLQLNDLFFLALFVVTILENQYKTP